MNLSSFQAMILKLHSFFCDSPLFLLETKGKRAKNCFIDRISLEKEILFGTKIYEKRKYKNIE